jgi:uncharacterized delta-60 repeat protein
MKRFILSVLSVLSVLTIFAQQQAWTATYNGGGNNMDAITSMVTDNAGNVYVTGYSYGSASNYDLVTIKYNTNGVRQWLAKYNGPGSGADIANSVFVDGAGNVYVTGYSDALTGNFIDNDATTIKYSPSGAQLWVARYDGGIQRSDAGAMVKVDASGNVYITGSTTVRNGAYSRNDYLTAKYNSAGVQLWKATYNGPGNLDDAAIGIVVDAAGNVYVTGTSFAGKDPVGEEDYVTIKYNAAGSQQWLARYNGPASEPDCATGIAIDNSANVYITGYSQGIDLDYATIKYNTDGMQQWVARYNGPANSADIAHAIKVDDAGNVYVTGGDQKIIYNSDYLTVKYNPAGIQQWTARFNGSANDNDEAYALTVDQAGNVFVTGYINGVSPGWDIETIRYNAAGVQQWAKKYNGPKDSADIGNAIGLDANGNVYVAGASTGLKSAWDYRVIKYNASALKNFSGSSSELSQPLISLLNYPNPVKNVTTIKFAIPFPAKVKLCVYDVNGKEITVLIDKQLQAGSHEVKWNGSNYPSGTYFYKLTTPSSENARYVLLTK